jgi:hypothetical protein
MEMEN